MGKKNKPRRGAALGGLADALVNAGLADEKAANRSHVERRREHKTIGAEGMAEREATKLADRERRQTFAPLPSGRQLPTPRRDATGN